MLSSRWGSREGRFGEISAGKRGVLAPVDEVAFVAVFDVEGWDALDVAVGPGFVHAGEQALAPAMRGPVLGNVLSDEINGEIGVGIATWIGDYGVGEDWIEDCVAVSHLDGAADDLLAVY